jgi:integrase
LNSAFVQPELLRKFGDRTRGPYGYTVTDAVRDWLAFGPSGRDSATVEKCTILAHTHVIPALGARSFASFRLTMSINGSLIRPRSSARELRHSFVSLLSDAGVPIEQISRLVGHSGTTTTETIYRKQIRPVLVRGADAMDLIFPTESQDE